VSDLDTTGGPGADSPIRPTAVPAQREAVIAERSTASERRWADDGEPAERMSGAAKVGTGTIVALAGGWFFYSWRVLKSPLIDAVGETAGATMVLLVVISLAGALRRN
jgi:hypothetical protein